MTNLESKCWELHNQQECCAPELGIIEDPEDIYTPQKMESIEERHEKFLDSVLTLITDDAGRKRCGHEGNLYLIADLWNAYAREEFTAQDVAAMLALAKIARISDDIDKSIWKDVAAYATLGGTL